MAKLFYTLYAIVVIYTHMQAGTLGGPLVHNALLMDKMAPIPVITLICGHKSEKDIDNTVFFDVLNS